MATLINTHLAEDTEVIGSRIGRIDPDNFRNQRTDDIDADHQDEEETDLFDEPVDAEGDPTGEHDHHQDDNYALGGHVTRSGSV
ncbi:hypothetical protein [Spirosoma fluviale]|uniref:Uncharacterized protein n=1 Tax=Spirosoma fluviale TaxID=1597977 RepID=A0A286GCK1_9BACT|nr:hypothetical protein [Spirosoma fluviale]SOD93247.1 hypothetical protein SAMN06269250_4429 [Spirosoma fluviale]